MKEQMKKTRKVVSLLIIGFVAGSTSALAAPSFREVDLDADSRWRVEYNGRTVDAVQNTTTFTYTVQVNDDPALSHFTAGFGFCDTAPAVSVYEPGNNVSIGLDPTTGVDGIKWDIGVDPGNTQVFSYTLQGNVGESMVAVAVKAGTYAAIGERPGPSCEAVVESDNHFDISGIIYLDANGDNAQGADEIGLANITVDLYDTDGNLIASTETDADGKYVFSDLPVGDYTVAVPAETEADDFNANLEEYFSSQVGAISVSLQDEDSSNNNFGYRVDTVAILNDFDASDPDNDGFVFVGTGKTIGYWKHQLTVAIKGKGRADVDAAILVGYLENINALYLADPFSLGSYEDAFAILKSTSSDEVDLLKKQLLGTEFNEMDGRGLVDDKEALQSVLIAWGEYIAANGEFFTRDETLVAKDIFDAINNSGE